MIMVSASLVFFGPVNVGKSTMIGYLYSQSLSQVDYEKEIAKIKEVTGENFRSDRFYSYFVDTSVDEYTKKQDKDVSQGTSKTMHLKRFGDFNLIDTPGGSDYAKQRYRGISMASIGVFTIDIRKLLDFRNDNPQTKYKEFNDFFSTWFIWKKMYGVKNTIIILTKYDLSSGQNNYENALIKLQSILGDDLTQTYVIPTSIRNDLPSINVKCKLDEPWYEGPCLIDAIKERCKCLIIDDTETQSLLMIHNALNKTNGSFSKSRWKILQGKLSVDDNIQIAPISINEKYVGSNVEVKEIEIDKKVVTTASSGDIVNVSLRISGKWDGYMPQVAIATSVNDDISFGNIVDIHIRKDKLISDIEWGKLCSLRERQHLSIIWFSDIIQGSIKSAKKENEELEFLLLLPHNQLVAFPKNMLPRMAIIQIPIDPFNDYIVSARGLVTGIYRTME